MIIFIDDDFGLLGCLPHWYQPLERAANRLCGDGLDNSGTGLVPVYHSFCMIDFAGGLHFVLKDRKEAHIICTILCMPFLQHTMCSTIELNDMFQKHRWFVLLEFSSKIPLRQGQQCLEDNCLHNLIATSFGICLQHNLAE